LKSSEKISGRVTAEGGERSPLEYSPSKAGKKGRDGKSLREGFIHCEKKKEKKVKNPSERY